MWWAVLKEVLQDSIQETMSVLLQQVLCKVPVCAPRFLWQQRGLPLLQQLEDQGRRPQMPINYYHHMYQPLTMNYITMPLSYFLA